MRRMVSQGFSAITISEEGAAHRAFYNEFRGFI